MRALLVTLISTLLIVVLMHWSYRALSNYCSNTSSSNISSPQDPPHSTINDATTSSQHVGSEVSKKKWKNEFFCDVKGGDFALGWATIFLVIVTAGLIWTGFRQEHFSKIKERAYIVAGGPFQRTNANNMPTGIAVMAIENRGNTPAFLNGVIWGLCPDEQFPKDIPVSAIFRKNLLSNFTNLSRKDFTDVYPANRGSEGIFSRVNFQYSAHKGQIFFAQINYKDVFGKQHYSTFKLKLAEDHFGSSPLPGCYSDWT